MAASLQSDGGAGSLRMHFPDPLVRFAERPYSAGHRRALAKLYAVNFRRKLPILDHKPVLGNILPWDAGLLVPRLLRSRLAASAIGRSFCLLSRVWLALPFQDLVHGLLFGPDVHNVPEPAGRVFETSDSGASPEIGQLV